MSKIVVILGANGALGRSVSRKFTDPSWTRLLCDISEPIDKECQFVALPRGASAKDQYAVLQKAVAGLTHGNGVVDAIVNVGGGFQMDSASSDGIFESLQAMYSSSFESSVLASHLAAKFLDPHGLLVLPGAAGATGPTPWAVTYGAMKAAVHHLVKSLSGKDSGIPSTAKVVGLAPIMLDTPMNRRSMPDADTSTWTPTDLVAAKVFAWANKSEIPESGAVYKMRTKDGQTDFIKI